MAGLTQSSLQSILFGLLVGLLLAWAPFATAQSVPAPASSNLPPGEWLLLRGEGFAIFHEASDQHSANELLELLDRFDDEFAANLGVEKPSGVRIFIAPTQARFRLLTRGLPHWTGGLAYPTRKLIMLPSPRLGPGQGPFNVTALHEYVHILTGHEGGRLPRWFSEGVAMYLSGETMYKNRTALGRAVVFNQTYTLQGIEDMLRLGPEQARIAYLQSISFVEFIVDRYGWEAIAALLHGYWEGRAPDDVFRELTGRDFYEVEVAFHRQLHDDYRWYNLLAWVNVDTVLWSGAAMLVAAVGTTVIIRRRRELHSDSSYIDESQTDPRMYEDHPDWDEDGPPPGEWYVDNDEYWR